jgi:hypothetical protein
MILGGWYENNKVYFDSVHNYFTLAAAKEACLSEEQLEFAYFNESGKFAGTYEYDKNTEKWEKN